MSTPQIPFDDPGTAEVYESVRTWADARGWQAKELTRRGARLERTWKLGDPGTRAAPAPDTGLLRLSVFAGTKAEASYGFLWSGARSSAGGDTAMVTWSFGGKKVTPDHVRLQLVPKGGQPLEYGVPLVYELGTTVLKTARIEGAEATQARIARYAAGGTTRTEVAMEDLDALEQLVKPALDKGAFEVCDYGPSPGAGVPGPCIPRGPTAEEVDSARTAFTQEMERRRGALAAPERWEELLASILPHAGG